MNFFVAAIDALGVEAGRLDDGEAGSEEGEAAEPDARSLLVAPLKRTDRLGLGTNERGAGTSVPTGRFSGVLNTMARGVKACYFCKAASMCC